MICGDTISDGSELTINRIENRREEAIGNAEQEIVAVADRDIEVRAMANQRASRGASSVRTQARSRRAHWDPSPASS